MGRISDKVISRGRNHTRGQCKERDQERTAMRTKVLEILKRENQAVHVQWLATQAEAEYTQKVVSALTELYYLGLVVRTAPGQYRATA